jgi:hypothetical protein
VTKRRLTGLDMRIEMVYGERGARSAREGSNELGLGRHQGKGRDGRVVSRRERLGVASRFYGSA